MDPVWSGGSATGRKYTEPPRGCRGSMVGPEKEQVSHSAGLDVSGFQSGAGPADPGQMQRALGQEFPGLGVLTEPAGGGH